MKLEVLKLKRVDYVCCVVYAQRSVFFRGDGGKVTIEETKSEDGNMKFELLKLKRVDYVLCCVCTEVNI